MSEEFDFFSTDANNFNFNEMFNKSGIDLYNNNKKLDPLGYNLYKFNCVILLKEILKHTSQFRG